MPFHFIDSLKATAMRINPQSFLHDFGFGVSSDIPDRLCVKPVDPWVGDANKAIALLQAAGVGERTGPQWFDEWWKPEDADDIWISHMHGFGWLRDLRTLGGPIAREQGRMMIESWLAQHGNWNKESWRADITGRRVAMWICHYDFFCASYDDAFETAFMSSLIKQARHLNNAVSNGCGAIYGTARFETIKGLLYAGIALEGQKKWVDQALKALERSVKKQILPDGGHISRSPSEMLEVLEVLVDIRGALVAGAREVPRFLTTTIENLSASIRTLRHRDRGFAVFHGAQERDVVDSVLVQAGTHKKAPNSLPDTGFERIELGRALLIMDTGAAPQTPYDVNAHASPLAFEFSYAKERLFVSCGTHPVSPDWKEALRFTAAHNTTCLDYRNACEIRKDGHFGRKVTKTNAERNDDNNACLVKASHNGYVSLNGITHTRAVYVSDEGHDLRGEDVFESASDLVQPVESATRFHLHPNVAASLTEDGKEVLLRMPGGIGWRFKHSSGEMKLEESLYLGEGVTPRKTKQIVIYAPIERSVEIVKWSLKQEG